MIKQVSIFLENKSGRMYEITKILGDNSINIRALSLADTSDFGILRLIVDDPEKAISILKSQHYTVSATNVVAIEISDKPGGLASLLEVFKNEGVNIEYMYAFLERKSEKAVMTFRFDNNQEVLDKLRSSGVKLLTNEELSKI
jgi:hypothetical protein